MLAMLFCTLLRVNAKSIMLLDLFDVDASNMLNADSGLFGKISHHLVIDFSLNQSKYLTRREHSAAFIAPIITF